MSHRSARSARTGICLAALGIVGILVGGCTVAVGPAPVAHARVSVVRAEAATPEPTRIIDNVQFGVAGGTPLLLDLCVPQTDVAPGIARRPAVILVHGGSWTHGDKSEWSGICRWLASAGFVAASIGYRLAPAHVYPAGIDDLETAVRWLRSPAQVFAYSINPDRIGAFGGSAGGNLVSLLGVRGTRERLDRVQAVVELSAPIDLTSNGPEQATFYPYELSYLGCTSYARCPQAVAASPIFHVASTDPPFFVAQSTNELIPLAQSHRFVAALRAAGVATTFVVRPGDRHSAAMLDPDLRLDILRFLISTLGRPALPSSRS